MFNRSTYRAYDLLTDNCLIRSVAAFKAYSSEFQSLPDGKRIRPNAYYDALRGWTTVRLCTSATVVFLAWLWGTIAPQAPVLATFTGGSISRAQEAIEGQAQRFSIDRRRR
ncbi:hypothetical protein [Streptomyces chartreusis]|uniref:hypothetical protein n=1 Tax=Streptomyces chartreusis TaxID=1969 RepID=UPI0033AB78F8